MEMEVSICQICKDPIWSFICPDCLAKDISDWLPRPLSAQFSRFHSNFSSYFHLNLDTAFQHCLNCKTSSEATICPFCYITEASSWLKSKKPRYAKRLLKMLPLGSDWKITERDGCVWRNGFKPLIENKSPKREFGICDECGEYSDGLTLVNGEWVCRECGSN